MTKSNKENGYELLRTWNWTLSRSMGIELLTIGNVDIEYSNRSMGIELLGTGNVSNCE